MDKYISILSNKVLDNILIMTITIYMSWPNYVPAVAVIRRRLVLFIFSRFKGYLDGKISPKQDTVLTRVIYEKVSIYGVELKFFDTLTTGNGESNLLSNNWRWGTKAWVTNRIRYPSSPSRELWMP